MSNYVWLFIIIDSICLISDNNMYVRCLYLSIYLNVYLCLSSIIVDSQWGVSQMVVDFDSVGARDASCIVASKAGLFREIKVAKLKLIMIMTIVIFKCKDDCIFKLLMHKMGY